MGDSCTVLALGVGIVIGGILGGGKIDVGGTDGVLLLRRLKGDFLYLVCLCFGVVIVLDLVCVAIASGYSVFSGFGNVIGESGIFVLLSRCNNCANVVNAFFTLSPL